MKDDEVRARFDGRGRVELIPGLSTAAKLGRIEDIAHALGYQRLAIENLGRAGTRLVYERDDGPQARRRAELTIARLSEGGPLLPAIEPPPPPPPSALPPAPAQAPPQQRSGPLSAPPPPPALFPPRPSRPPGPPSVPCNAPTS
ncbi:hypothetical protein [Streptomyces sp. NPDC056982]|uniref:hypothetical protein n=1 Tax=unclassified Streptomyces TaxID=2593676 RepID=UPI003638EBDD